MFSLSKASKQCLYLRRCHISQIIRLVYGWQLARALLWCYDYVGQLLIKLLEHIVSPLPPIIQFLLKIFLVVLLYLRLFEVRLRRVGLEYLIQIIEACRDV